MTYLIVGLVLFFSMHSLKIFRATRASLLAKMGETPYKAAYTFISLAGFGLIIFGFVDYRGNGLVPVWSPPFWTGHLALLLNWIAAICLAATYLPCHIRKALKHPMLAGVIVWAAAHLLANGDLGGMILFGTFLLWAIVIRIRVMLHPAEGKPGKASIMFDLAALAAGSAYYAVIVFWLHPDIFNIPVWPG